MSNDKIILDQILEAKRSVLAPSVSASEFFEVFTAEQILKDFDLSYEEIEAGILGGSGDGGIDGLFVFVNGELVQDDTDFSAFKKNIELELVITQAKISASFGEAAMDKFAAVSEDLLDLSKSILSFSSVYSAELRDGMEIFRKAHAALVTRFPKIRITFAYATKGDSVDPKVTRKAPLLRDKVTRFFSAAEVLVRFLGAPELLELARQLPKTTFTLSLAEAPISSSGDIGYVCLVRLEELYKFITDASGNLQRNVFEANVRDYQGRTEVNDSIADSLNQATEDFWWLNNGITVLASQVTSSGKTLTIEDPQIVNGLQTSTEIFNYFKRSPNVRDTRNLLVRVIVPVRSESRDRIIKATNSQTAVQPASLRATDKVHRDIEEYLLPFGLFYDRRKNRYKNEGKPVERIVGIPMMAQAVMSIVLQRPNDARARPSSLLKSQSDYDQLFSSGMPISVYRVCAEIVRRTESFLKQDASLALKDRANIRFYVAMYASAVAMGSAKPSTATIAAFDPAVGLTSTVLQDSYQSINALYIDAGRTDQAAKGSDLLEAITQALVVRFPWPTVA